MPMKARLVSNGIYAHVNKEMTFVYPFSERICDLEYKLRHLKSKVSTGDMVLAASVISSYRELFTKTQKDRNAVIQAINNLEQ